MAKALTQEQVIARRCIKEAREMLGPGWRHVSVEVQWGLVSARLLNVFTSCYRMARRQGTDKVADVSDYLLALTQAARAEMFPEDR